MNSIIYSIFNFPTHNKYFDNFSEGLMCYLRNFAPIQKSSLYKELTLVDQGLENEKPHAPYQNLNDGFEFLQNLGLFGNSQFNPELFSNLIKLAQKNSQAIENISQKMEQNDILLDFIQEQRKCSHSTEESKQAVSDTQESSMGDSPSFKSQQIITKKLFGENKEYKYKLNLEEGFPEQIFKQRNFSFSLNLTDTKGNKIRNSNIIHLCLGVCDVNGEWVTQTKSKEPLMKGKTDSELYHGQGSFTKIYSRDVSRFYPDSKLNIVVYPKQSALKYCQGSNGLQEAVNFSEIQPLIIKDLTIKAKKKE